jgi:hypothetical protein
VAWAERAMQTVGVTWKTVSLQDETQMTVAAKKSLEEELVRLKRELHRVFLSDSGVGRLKD